MRSWLAKVLAGIDLTCPTFNPIVNPVMNIDNLIEKLINAKSQGATTVDIVDQNWYEYTIEAVELNDSDEDAKTVIIQVGSDW